jgi:cytochrome oxidase Cu insertion factor (SCO1/SenC/PrrC family)
MRAMRKFWVTFAVTVLTMGFCTATIAADTTPVLDAVNVNFELLNRDGEVVREADFQGQNVLLAFGFTHCLHICPLIAANMASVLKMAETDAIGVFISVDTERDSPAIVDDYAHGFSDRMMGLGGSYEQVSAAVNNFNATFVVTKTADNYTVQHTPSIFLIGPDGKLIDVFAMNTTSQVIADAMK